MIGEGWRRFARRILHPFRRVRDTGVIDTRYRQILIRLEALEKRVKFLEKRVEHLEENYRRLFRVK